MPRYCFWPRQAFLSRLGLVSDNSRPGCVPFNFQYSGHQRSISNNGALAAIYQVLDLVDGPDMDKDAAMAHLPPDLKLPDPLPSIDSTSGDEQQCDLLDQRLTDCRPEDLRAVVKKLCTEDRDIADRMSEALDIRTQLRYGAFEFNKRLGVGNSPQQSQRCASAQHGLPPSLDQTSGNRHFAKPCAEGRVPSSYATSNDTVSDTIDLTKDPNKENEDTIAVSNASNSASTVSGDEKDDPANSGRKKRKYPGWYGCGCTHDVVSSAYSCRQTFLSVSAICTNCGDRFDSTTYDPSSWSSEKEEKPECIYHSGLLDLNKEYLADKYGFDSHTYSAAFDTDELCVTDPRFSNGYAVTASRRLLAVKLADTYLS